jgi:hypothetical protein
MWYLRQLSIKPEWKCDNKEENQWKIIIEMIGN